MRAVSEQPRIATTIAAALIALVLVGVGASHALGGGQRIHRSDPVLRLADTQLAQLRQQLQTAQAEGAELRGQVTTLTAALAHARQSQRSAATTSPVTHARAKH